MSERRTPILIQALLAVTAISSGCAPDDPHDHDGSGAIVTAEAAVVGRRPVFYFVLHADPAPDLTERWRNLERFMSGLEGHRAALPERVGRRHRVTIEPRAWGTMGTSMGFFFGGDRMRAGIYRTVADGRPPNMPAWGAQLSREQLWALVRHIEGF